MSTPKHRIVPYLSDENRYVSDIMETRKSIQGIDTSQGQQTGPIRHALENIINFDCPAEWMRDHLLRFQVVCFVEQPPSNMYPSQFLPRRDDAVMRALEEESFFRPTKDDVKAGNWKYNNLNNNFILDLMQLLIGAEGPKFSLAASPRESTPRASKTSARQAIREIMAHPQRPLRSIPSASGTASHGSESPDSRFAADTLNTNSLVYWGPRETSTHSLFHNLLKSLARLEWDLDDVQDKMWLPCVDSSKLPVIAAGQIFDCENDGEIHVWKRTAFTAQRINSTPICQIECKREYHAKNEDSIVAQEVAELLGMALLNYATNNPSIELTDESFLLCCHHTSFHISSAIVPSSYIEGVHLDELKDDEYLVVKRSQKYDLAIPNQRRRAVQEIIGLLRYLKSMSR